MFSELQDACKRLYHILVIVMLPLFVIAVELAPESFITRRHEETPRYTYPSTVADFCYRLDTNPWPSACKTSVILARPPTGLLVLLDNLLWTEETTDVNNVGNSSTGHSLRRWWIIINKQTQWFINWVCRLNK